MNFLSVFFVFTLIASGENFSIPSSPCPDIFKYTYDGTKWSGLITVKSTSISDTIKLNVAMNVKAVVSNNNLGTIELLGSYSEIKKSLINSNPIQYKVTFPTTNPIPKISQITFNNQVICSSHTISGLVTEISLEHRFNINFESKKTEDNIHMAQRFEIPSIPTKPPTRRFEKFKPKPTRRKPQEIEINFNPDMEIDSFPFPNWMEYNDICGLGHSINPLVVNGQGVQRGEFPWLAAIYKQTDLGLEFHCSGSLLTQFHVVVAAHCIQYGMNKPLEPSELVIILGKHNLRNWRENGASIVEVQKIFLHPDYGKASVLHSDIGVLRLSFPISFSQFIRPICLIDQDVASSLGNVGIVVGWGRDNQGLTTVPKMVQMPIVSQEECLRSKQEFRYFTSDTTFCAGNRDGSGPCNGDSGVGIIQKWGNQFFLRGITSLSLKNPETFGCDLTQYTIFTDIFPFMKWLERILTTT